MRQDYSYLREQYPAIISAEQLRHIFHSSKKTIKRLIENGAIPAKDSGKKTWRFFIQLEDAIRYLETKGDKLTIVATGLPTRKSKINAPAKIEDLQKGLEELWKSEPDILGVKEVSQLTGFSKTCIVQWVEKGKLPRILYKRKFIIPKSRVIQFVLQAEPYSHKVRLLENLKIIKGTPQKQ